MTKWQQIVNFSKKICHLRCIPKKKKRRKTWKIKIINAVKCCHICLTYILLNSLVAHLFLSTKTTILFIITEWVFIALGEVEKSEPFNDKHTGVDAICGHTYKLTFLLLLHRNHTFDSYLRFHGFLNTKLFRYKFNKTNENIE